jgi:hypothetical protein
VNLIVARMISGVELGCNRRLQTMEVFACFANSAVKDFDLCQ